MPCRTNKIEPSWFGNDRGERYLGTLACHWQFLLCSYYAAQRRQETALGCLFLESKGIAHCTTEIISGPAHQYQTSMLRKEKLKHSRWRPALSGWPENRKAWLTRAIKQMLKEDWIAPHKYGFRMQEVSSAEKEQIKLNTTSTRTTESKVTENTGIWYSEASNCFGRLKIPNSFINWTRFILKSTLYCC